MAYFLLECAARRFNRQNKIIGQVLIAAFCFLCYYVGYKSVYRIVVAGAPRIPFVFQMFAIAYTVSNCFAAICHIRLLNMSPGFVLPGQELPSSITVWDECGVCKARRPLGTHHCRVCDKCVLKRDHHCPWINSCVGFGNQWLFMVFASHVVFCAGVLTVFQLEYLITQTCSTCTYAETRVSSALSFVLSLLTTLAAIGVMMGQLRALGRRVAEVQLEMEAQKLNSDLKTPPAALEEMTEEEEEPETAEPLMAYNSKPNGGQPPILTAADEEMKRRKELRETLVMEMRAWKTVFDEIRGGHLRGVKALLALTPFWVRPAGKFELAAAI